VDAGADVDEQLNAFGAEIAGRQIPRLRYVGLESPRRDPTIEQSYIRFIDAMEAHSARSSVPAGARRGVITDCP